MSKPAVIQIYTSFENQKSPLLISMHNMATIGQAVPGAPKYDLTRLFSKDNKGLLTKRVVWTVQ